MIDLNDFQQVIDLVESTPETRSHLTAQIVKKQTQQTLKAAVKLLEHAYNLTYLEAKLHCDAFHEGKKGFADLKLTYGYITSWVRRESGTNAFRFAYRRPTGKGYIIKEGIRMPAKGYTRLSFRQAAHPQELELALMTEESYARLRRQSKAIKSKLRTIRALDIFPGESNEEEKGA